MNSILIYILTCIHSIYDFIIEKIYELYFLNSKRNLPPIENSPIILESAVDLATKIRKRQLSAESCVKSFIEHNKLINPYINAVVCNDFENALKEARNVDNYLKNTQETEEEIKKSKPFLGVPFSTKESTSVKGLSHTLAILARKNAKAIEDSDVISYMKEAGAIFLCLTNIPELNMWCETRNLIFGQTNNPYDLRKNVGGSSGGEAALLSACGSPFGIGTDIGGSIRMPAFFNGIFGHKPTTGLISLKGLTLRDDEVKDSMVCPGPMTKHAKDLAPMLEILLGPNKHLLKLDQEVPVEKINFFYIESINDLRISPLNKDMKYAMNKVLNYLKSKNIHPIKIEIEELKYSFKLWRYFMSKESMDFGSIISLEPNCRANPFKELFLKLIGKGRFTIAAIMNLLNTDYFPKENSEMCEELFKIILSKLEVLLGSNTVLLFPSSPYPANFHYTALWNPYNFGYWAAINVLKLPATQVPLGLTSKGMPIGVQVVASRFNDHLTISVAKELEKGLGGWVSPFFSKDKY